MERRPFLDLKNKPLVFWCFFLALLVGACFSPALKCGFVNYDDPQYFYENPHVLVGLTAENIAWAFKTEQLASRYPLTWLSLMLDASLFGKDALGPHLTNLLLHVANTVLVFLLLRGLTGSFWRSLAVAALFGLHPLRVEAVAWISERKGLLSAFFSLLAIWAYARCVMNRKGVDRAGLEVLKSGFLWLAFVFFGLALMAKPVAVTLPFVFLLLDYWPLGRINLSVAPGKSLARLATEKIPFFALTIAACAVTVSTHREAGAMVAMTEHSIFARIQNTLVSYGWYVGKTFWPTNLALPYPMPPSWPVSQVIVAALIVGILSIAAVRFLRARPYLSVGWLWFLGTLVPVIGLVRWGDQAMADRFSYFPTIGLFILLMWGLADLLARWNVPKNAFWVGATAILVVCAARTVDQLKYWKNSEALFRHSLAVTKENHIATFNLGSALVELNRSREALPLLVKAVAHTPRDAEAQYNLGSALMKEGRLDEAKTHLEIALTNDTSFARAWLNLGSVAFQQGQRDVAARHYRKVMELEPRNSMARCNLGILLLEQGKVDEAAGLLKEAVHLESSNADAQANLAVALARQGHPAEALPHFAEAARLNPEKVDAQRNFGLALMELGRFSEAEARFNQALRLQPNDAQAHYRLAQALLAQRKTGDAIKQFREAIRLQSQNTAALNGLAYVLATASDAKLRDGTEAVRLAQRACELTKDEPGMLVTLAAAQAEAGNFPEAVPTAEKAAARAMLTGDNQTTTRARALLDVLQAGKAYRERF